MSAERLSVIVPAFDCAAFLPEAVSSVRRQGVDGVEIVVVDDGSTDDTAAVARSLGPDVRVIAGEHGGPARARNAGLEGARGDLVAFLDADDVWPDGSLAARRDRLLADTGVDVVLGRTRAMLRQDDGGYRPLGEPWHCPLVGCGLYRRRVLDAVGLFDETLRQSEDLDWFLRMRELLVPTVRIEDVTLHYRLHGANLTWGAGPAARNILLALKRSLDRRRGESGEVRRLARAEDARPGARVRKEPPPE